MMSRSQNLAFNLNVRRYTMADCSECNSDADATVSDSTDPTCFAPGYHSRDGWNKMVGTD
jgi:hypothetical protein